MASKMKDYRFDGSRRLDLCDTATSAGIDPGLKAEYVERTAANTKLIGKLQDKLYAQGREGLLVVFQAMDAAGKDSTIKAVLSGVNPQGIDITSFKTPSKEELAHGYLWRARQALPARGKIAVFNRSYYEDVLVVRVHKMWKGYDMPERCLDDTEDEFCRKRFRQIGDFEEYLYENGFRVVKFFLNVGQDEQKRRFLERIDNPEKNWKFSSSDIEERQHWPAYMAAYEDVVNATATKHAPWYVIPADQKFYMRWLVSEAIVKTLKDMEPCYPDLPQAEKDHLAACRERLLSEGV